MKSEMLNKPISLYLSAEHQCSYLEQQQANSLFVDPSIQMRNSVYSILIQQGFRRSGNYVYTPYCKVCHECIPVRINVNAFKPDRTQRRCWNRNKHLTLQAKPAVFIEEHFQLYADYLNSRHPDGGMEKPTKSKYLDFLTTRWADTIFYEFKEGNNLIAVAVTDIVFDGLSSVYTFFNTSNEFRQRSLGSYAILWQIEEARRRNLPWTYLGYWIKNCNKMNYKTKFQPIEYYYNNQWHSTPPEHKKSQLHEQST